MPKITVPEGCNGLTMEDGTRYNANREGRVDMRSEHADVLSKSWYQSAGVMSASERVALGTRTGRTCTTCSPTRRWNAWNTHCRICGSPTIKETDSYDDVCAE